MTHRWSGRVSPKPLVLLAASMLLLSAGCGVSRTVKVAVPPRYALARTSTLDEALGSLRRQQAAVQSLSCASLRVNFTSGTAEAGQLKEYHSAPGYLLLKRPDQVRLNIQNPITKTSIAELVSSGDDFGLWVPRDNKYYHGKNSAREYEVDKGPGFTAKPSHIFEALLPQLLDSAGAAARLAWKEEQDAVTKYYVLSVFRAGEGELLVPLRDLWMDRSSMMVARQRTYLPDGAVESLIEYSNWQDAGGVPLPLDVRIDRPHDGYSLELRLKEWKLNPELPADAFVLNPPPGAVRVELREKARG